MRIISVISHAVVTFRAMGCARIKYLGEMGTRSLAVVSGLALKGFCLALFSIWPWLLGPSLVPRVPMVDIAHLPPAPPRKRPEQHIRLVHRNHRALQPSR